MYANNTHITSCSTVTYILHVVCAVCEQPGDEEAETSKFLSILVQRAKLEQNASFLKMLYHDIFVHSKKKIIEETFLGPF